MDKALLPITIHARKMWVFTLRALTNRTDHGKAKSRHHEHEPSRYTSRTEDTPGPEFYQAIYAVERDANVSVNVLMNARRV